MKPCSHRSLAQAYEGYTSARGDKLPKNYLIVTPGDAAHLVWVCVHVFMCASELRCLLGVEVAGILHSLVVTL